MVYIANYNYPKKILFVLTNAIAKAHIVILQHMAKLNIIYLVGFKIKIFIALPTYRQIIKNEQQNDTFIQ